MKLKKPSILLASLCALLVPLALNAADKDDKHAGHDRDGEEQAKDEHAGHDYDGAKEAGAKEAGDEHAGHDHAKKVAGPNGGRIITSVEPHIEFFVTKDRKVQITVLGHDNKAVPAGEQTVRIVCGERSAPTRLVFTKKGDVLISDKPLPAGKNIPTVLQIKTKASAESVRERFNLNLNDCPGCDYLEYSCTCTDH